MNFEQGYGDRVSKRDHRPGGFSLELGYKDVCLVQQAAKDAKVAMPYLSVLVDRLGIQTVF
jgi:3-hydroxyisobutyrate dehydrogenase-like beta-hydroxyacid dehydrogenase